MNYYDPYKEMKDFYRKEDPTEEDQFRFVEAMEYLINYGDMPYVYMYNLACYYLDIRNFDLEKKYAEMAIATGDKTASIILGYLWYYGQTGTVDYKKAYSYFKMGEVFPQCKYKIADMYKYGYYVEKDISKYRDMIDELFIREDRNKGMVYSTRYPEVAYRMAQIDFENGEDTQFDLDILLEARDILAKRQSSNAFWGNIKTMHRILDLISEFTGDIDYDDLLDVYDLLTLDLKDAKITFNYDEKDYLISIFTDKTGTIYEFGNKWFHGADDFLENARIEGHRFTTVYDKIGEITVNW